MLQASVHALLASHSRLPLCAALPCSQDMPTGKDTEGISDSAEWRALQEHVKDINAT